MAEETIYERELYNRFSYHAPTDVQIASYRDIRAKARDLAYLLDDTVPDGREKSLAMTKLEEAVMWANAGIARRSEPST